MYHCVEGRANTLNSNCTLPAVLVPEGKCVKCFLFFKARTSATVVGFSGRYSSSAIIFVQLPEVGVQSWGSGAWVPVTAAGDCSGDKAWKRTEYPKGAKEKEEL